MAVAVLPRHSHDLMESLSVEDFETASIRSAAPSYSSETPSTHYTVPNHAGGLLPPYVPPERSAARRSGSGANAPSCGFPVGGGGRGDVPNLSQFRIPSWSTISSNPNARLYHSVALRRVAAAEHASAAAEIGGLMRRLAVLERAELEEAAASARNARNGGSSRANSNAISRPLEDPFLVGEAAAHRTRTARLARDIPISGDDALIHEDRRWDWFLGQMKTRHRPGTSSSRVRRQFDTSRLPGATLRHLRSGRF